MPTSADVESLLQPLLRIHAHVRDHVVGKCESEDLALLAGVVSDGIGDTKFQLDQFSEDRLVPLFEEELEPLGSFVLIAEGLEDGPRVFPAGMDEAKARWRIIVDPVDGTRGMAYQKRSAWILTGVAPNKGRETNLQDIVLAVQTEIPLVKQHLSDVVWATREGVHAERFNRLTRETAPLALHPSTAPTIDQGFAMLARFFPGAREELASIDDEIAREVVGPARPGKATCFEDQYISSAGQLYELMAGHDRFVADLRPLMERFLEKHDERLGLCCHPYDLCTELIARKLGVIVTDPAGDPLKCPLDLETNVAWVGYANAAIRRQVEPALRRALTTRGLLR